MKKWTTRINLLVLIASLLSIAFTFQGCIPVRDSPAATVAQFTEQAQAANAAAAVTDTPIPKISYFTERRTVAKWAEYWDKPAVVTYVYCVSFGKVMGYYVCNGKPASTRSYLTPEYRLRDGVDLGECYGELLVEAPDIDGCYGDNNPGIRGFTASGIPFEWSGYGASQMISGAPLPFDVPCLGK